MIQKTDQGRKKGNRQINQKIVSLAQEKYQAKQDYDYPPMIIYNLPLNGFDETGFTDPKLVKEQLILGVKKLEQAGSDLIDPCQKF